VAPGRTALLVGDRLSRPSRSLADLGIGCAARTKRERPRLVAPFATDGTTVHLTAAHIDVAASKGLYNLKDPSCPLIVLPYYYALYFIHLASASFGCAMEFTDKLRSIRSMFKVYDVLQLCEWAFRFHQDYMECEVNFQFLRPGRNARLVSPVEKIDEILILQKTDTDEWGEPAKGADALKSIWRTPGLTVVVCCAKHLQRRDRNRPHLASIQGPSGVRRDCWSPVRGPPVVAIRGGGGVEASQRTADGLGRDKPARRATSPLSKARVARTRRLCHASHYKDAEPSVSALSPLRQVHSLDRSVPPAVAGTAFAAAHQRSIAMRCPSPWQRAHA
jgi:hypothetical protein